uniref:Uncharacterized protein n=1 Tax=Peronospora matthiolae TaxID=2874970 RepID=A0AAV1U8V3_9STRA
MKSPHLAQRISRWLSFFPEYNFIVHYKPGKTKILADALSRRPDYDPRIALSRQATDDDDEDGRCAMCDVCVVVLNSGHIQTIPF